MSSSPTPNLCVTGDAEPRVEAAANCRVGAEAPVAERHVAGSAAVLLRGAAMSEELERESIIEVDESMCGVAVECN